MNQAKAKEAISSTCRSLVKRAETRKTWRGIVGLPHLRLVQPPIVTLQKRKPSAAPDPAADMAGVAGGKMSGKRRRGEVEDAVSVSDGDGDDASDSFERMNRDAVPFKRIKTAGEA